MADEEKGADGTRPPAPDAHGTDPMASAPHPITEPVASPGAHPDPASPDPAATEWTASDGRGPLNPASGADVTPPAEPTDGAPAPTPIASTSPPSSLGPPARRRSLAGPVFAGLVVGALIGAGSAALVYRLAAGDGTSGQSLDALSARVNALDALPSRVDALAKRPDPQGAIDGLKSSLASLDGKITDVRKTVAAQRQPEAAATTQDKAGATQDKVAAPAFDPGPLEGRIAALRTDLEALRKEDAAVKGDAAGLQGKVAGIGAALAGVRNDASAAQTGLADLKGEQKTLADQAKSLEGQQKGFGVEQQALRAGQKTLEGKVNAPALAVVADSLVQQVGRGLPYATQVEALGSLGADPARIAILRQGADKGVPSAKVLADKFAPLADPVASTARKAPPGAGFMDRMKSGLFSMISIRSEGDTTGDGLGARVSRIQDDLVHDDVADAYATWAALPAEAKAKSETWGALAKTHAEAMTAARALQHDAIAALGAKKS